MSHFSIWTGSGNCQLNIYRVREMVLVRGLPVKLNGHTWWWSLSRIKNINYIIKCKNSFFKTMNSFIIIIDNNHRVQCGCFMKNRLIH